MEEGGGGEVREGAADSSKGDARSSGVCVCVGGRGEDRGHLRQHPRSGHLGFQRIKWL